MPMALRESEMRKYKYNLYCDLFIYFYQQLIYSDVLSCIGSKSLEFEEFVLMYSYVLTCIRSKSLEFEEFDI